MSLTVPYDHTRDFFYSGHTGTLTLMFVESVRLRMKVMSILAAVSWFFMVNMLLITKVHYMADIAGGLIFALWFYWLGAKIVVYVDKLISLPYVLGRKIY
jgi:xanthine/uracil permease